MSTQVTLIDSPPEGLTDARPDPELEGDSLTLVSLLDALTLRGVIPKSLTVGSVTVELGATIKSVPNGESQASVQRPRSYLSKALDDQSRARNGRGA